jgi:hypothetical protein
VSGTEDGAHYNGRRPQRRSNFSPPAPIIPAPTLQLADVDGAILEGFFPGCDRTTTLINDAKSDRWKAEQSLACFIAV